MGYRAYVVASLLVLANLSAGCGNGLESRVEALEKQTAEWKGPVKDSEWFLTNRPSEPKALDYWNSIVSLENRVNALPTQPGGGAATTSSDDIVKILRSWEHSIYLDERDLEIVGGKKAFDLTLVTGSKSWPFVTISNTTLQGYARFYGYRWTSEGGQHGVHIRMEFDSALNVTNKFLRLAFFQIGAQPQMDTLKIIPRPVSTPRPDIDVDVPRPWPGDIRPVR
jgi:hypothetical protein